MRSCLLMPVTWNPRLLSNLTRLTSNVTQDSNAEIPCKWPIASVNHGGQSLRSDNDNRAKVNMPEVDVVLVTPGSSCSGCSCLRHSCSGLSCSGLSCSGHSCLRSSGRSCSGSSCSGSSFGSSHPGSLSKSKPLGGSLSFFSLL